MPVDAPYGAWESPITSQAITAGSVKLSDVMMVGGALHWVEGRPQEQGRYVLCRHAPEDPARSERDGVDATPAGSNVRTRVHEYGGGAVAAAANGDVFFSEFASQRVYRVPAGGGEAVPITPDGGRYRFADGVHSADRDTLYFVCEDHEHPKPKDVVNSIVAVRAGAGADADAPPTVVARGNDFYAAPRLSPDGTQLAYVTWNHPNMPWDATELRVVPVGGGAPADTAAHARVAGADGDTSVMQPLWHPTTGDLYYLSDESGFYNIYRAAGGEGGAATPVLPMAADFGGAAPGWVFGAQGFSFLPDGRLAAAYKKDGASRLVVADVSAPGAARDVQEFSMEHGLPMQFGGVLGAPGGDLYFIGGSPSAPSCVYKWNLTAQGPAAPLACSSSLSFPDAVISVPKAVAFPTTLGEAYGYYYAPKNDGYASSEPAPPPLLVKAHGGPTACTGAQFNAGIQFWTSRGFAVLDVDYGGSTGYGREYRRRLRKAWGVVDIDDVCAGAQYLVAQGLADGARLCIDGGSAGGYTTLGALAFRDVFKAGCSLYGIGDLCALAGDTHKFESRYLDGLVGAYPEEEAVYKARSPIESVATLSCPILILQGDEDKIVPLNQAELMHKALLQKGIPTCLRVYKGEQHGFRKAENIQDALDSELAFYGRVFGIDVPGAVDITIDNM
eukprot:TRINITY_DN21085_c0_g1_i1.p1 TRINITY_DN21085_c0_g1~~TRINITY_DN21085_c0_g1_i1.p1  ORF type:complete len:672 (+),score=277.15 TRINITY_DN21085_c0_g1_i1:56-2071(+)